LLTLYMTTKYFRILVDVTLLQVVREFGNILHFLPLSPFYVDMSNEDDEASFRS